MGPAQEQGLIGLEIRQTFQVWYCFSLVFNIIIAVFGRVNYSQMVSFDSPTYCNTYFWSFQKIDQIWTLGTRIYHQNTPTNAIV